MNSPWFHKNGWELGGFLTHRELAWFPAKTKYPKQQFKRIR
jgi:hypothetical protein